ncbi:MAG: hypothetical protein AMS24_01565 [Chlamydiae bacterium SM23_39]|nr:MAG: hypothetical protein AMS24_01565 [Chlamydiae bacterium SM23_39]
MTYLKKIENIQNFLKRENIDFLILEDKISLFYLTKMDIEGKLIIGKNKTRLFVDKRYVEQAEKKNIFEVFLLEDDLISDFFLVHSDSGAIAFNSKNCSYFSYKNLNIFIEKLKKQASKEIDFKLIDIYDPLKEERAIKSQDEIYSMKKAASIAWRGFEHICSLLKEGISEKSLALEFELFCLQNGGEGLAFNPIIAFGENSSICHHTPDQTLLKKDDIVLIDVGVKADNYCSDMTRVLFFGTPNPILEKFYEIIRKVHRNILDLCKPGVTIKKLDETARELIEKEKVEGEILHALGHGVGLEVHEYPIIKYDGQDKDVILRPNMVITIEPAIYKKGIGGVRYEDTILITKEGFENFYTIH